MVDARHVGQHIEDSSECQEQIAFADPILLNKTDLVPEKDLLQLESRLKQMNATATILRARQAEEYAAAHTHDASVTSVGIPEPGPVGPSPARGLDGRTPAHAWA